MSARTAGLLLWLLLGGLAAATVFWRLTHPPRPPAVTGAGQPPPELPAVEMMQPFQLPPPAHYGDVIARPLFITARRPEPPPPEEEASLEKPKPPAGPDQKFMLLGVLIAPATTAVLLRTEEPNAKTMRVRPGDMMGEWRLEAVFPDRIVLRKGQATQEVPLARPKKPAGPRANRGGVKPRTPDAPPPVQGPVVAPQHSTPPPQAIIPAPPQN